MFNERCLAKEVGATQVHWKNIRSPNTNRAKEKKRRMYNTHKSISNYKIQEKKKSSIPQAPHPRTKKLRI